MTPTQTALVVVVPQAEAVVAPLRARLDTAAGWGVPAHVTVLYPFLAPDRVGHEVLAGVTRAVAQVSRFDVTFSRVGWFGDTVLWLAPQPADPFRRLTAALWRRFPQVPPYAGAHTDPVPHLTVGHDASREVLQRAAGAVQAQLPIRASVSAVRLLCGSPEPDSWHTLCDFPLREAHPGRAGAVTRVGDRGANGVPPRRV